MVVVARCCVLGRRVGPQRASLEPKAYRAGKFWWFFGRKCLLPFFAMPQQNAQAWRTCGSLCVRKWVGRDNGRPRGSEFHSTGHRRTAVDRPNHDDYITYGRTDDQDHDTPSPRWNRFTTPSSRGLLLPTPKIKHGCWVCVWAVNDHHCSSISYSMNRINSVVGSGGGSDFDDEREVLITHVSQSLIVRIETICLSILWVNRDMNDRFGAVSSFHSTNNLWIGCWNLHYLKLTNGVCKW